VKISRQFIFIGLLSLFLVGGVAAQKNKTPVTEKFAGEFVFTDFNGKERKFSEFRGKYVLLDFWATWCRPCLADFPKLKELYDKHRVAGFEIIGMDAETIGDEESEPDPEFARETEIRAKAIVTTRGINWTQATSATAVPIAGKIFGVKALPAKILIDPDGKIIKQFKETKEIDEFLTRVLSENKQ